MNRDGWIDLYVTNAEIRDEEDLSVRDGRNLLLVNMGDWQFVANYGSPVQSTDDYSQAALFTDVNGDGLLDLSVFNGLTFPLITNRNRLYFGTEGGDWIAAESSAWSHDTQANVSGSWADFDRDGDLDLFIVDNSPQGANVLMRNNGDGTLMVDTDSAPGPARRPGRMATWIDIDEDGDEDLVLITFQFGSADTPPVYVYLNQLAETGTASFNPKNSGGTIVEDLTPEASMGISAVDIDNDGDRDIHITQGWSASRDLLYRNLGGGHFERVENDPLVTTGGYSSSSCWGDFDNDADLDVFISTFNTFSTSGWRDRLYLNDGVGNFSAADGADATNEFTQAKGCALADVDNDGDLDLAVATGHLPSGIREAARELNGMYENDLQTGAHWIRIRLTGSARNTEAIGAKIRVEALVDGSPVIQTRWVEGGPTGDRGQNERIAHFGLGNASVVDRVVVNWPTGAVDEWTNLDVDTVHHLGKGTGATGVDAHRQQSTSFSVFPNPARDQVALSVDLVSSSMVTLRVLDLLGRTVIRHEFGSLVAGAHRRTINVAGLSAGSYIAQIVVDKSEYLNQHFVVIPH